MSSPLGTLYVVPKTPVDRIMQSVLSYTHQEVKPAEGYVHYQTNKTPAFTSKFPHGKIPAFEGNDGFKLFESVAIAKYFAALAPKSNLLGRTNEEKALVDQWVSFAQAEIVSNLYHVRGLLAHRIPYNKVFDDIARSNVHRALETLNTVLQKTTFLAFHRLSLADIYVASAIHSCFETLLDAELREKLPNLQRYYDTVVNQEGIKAIFGEPEYCEKAIRWTPPPKEEKHKEHKKEEHKKEEHKKEEKPKEEKKPKKKDDDDEEEEETHAEPKAKNPLDDLPKSNFNLEDWKRAYSNLDTRGAGGSLEWFYEKFDPQGFSIWRVDFKYNSELTLVFMSSNQIGGFFNRLEGSRKYLFGSMGVLGSANDSVITGVFILRGLDHKAVVEAAPDWESYNYKPLKVTGSDANADDKAFFEAALAWDLEVDGRKWADGKNFK